MKYLYMVLAVTFLTACTNTHRLMLVYESDQAVQGTISIMEEPVPKTVTVVPRQEAGAQYELDLPETNVVEVEKDEKSVLDNVRSLLP